MAFENNLIITTMPTKASQGADWIAWHKLLDKTFARKTANAIWLKAWEQRKSTGANTRELQEYMADKGVKIDSTGVVQDLTNSALDFADSIGGMFSMGKYIAIGVVILIVAPVSLLLFNIARKPTESIGAAAKGYATVKGRG